MNIEREAANASEVEALRLKVYAIVEAWGDWNNASDIPTEQAGKQLGASIEAARRVAARESSEETG